MITKNSQTQDSFLQQLSMFQHTLIRPVNELIECWQSMINAVCELADDCQSDIDRISSAIAQLQTLASDLESAVDIDLIHDANTIDNAHRTLRHDLRSPINAIKGYSEILLEDHAGEGHENLRRQFKQLLRCCDALISRIDLLASTPNNTSNTDSDTVETIPKLEQIGHILVVDDLATNRELLRKRLRHQGHDVECANGGKEALKMLSGSDFDLVLLDMLMPEMDGYEVLLRIKSDPQLKHVPVIVVSALDDMKSVIRCIEAGAEDYLTKPFDATLLKARIGSSLEKKRLLDITTALVNRLEGELEDAKRAQLSMVPHEFPHASLLRPVSVHAHMQPAREVGGDFYDFLYTGEDHLWLLVGDVSDKGVASGMFMARTVALMRFITNHLFDQTKQLLMPHEVLNHLNTELCEFNADITFVTLLLARLNIRTGELLTGNAGHCAPCVLSKNSAPEYLETIIGRPVGIRSDSKYQTHTTTLAPEQHLFLYTDGVTDAQNNSDDIFGEERMLKSLSKPADKTPQNIIRCLQENIAAFVGDAPQFDDITMLAVRWDGDSICIKKNLMLSNSLNEINYITEEITSFCLKQGVSTTVTNDIAVVVDEVLSNAITYAHPDIKKHNIAIGITATTSSITLVFDDDGIAFNPLAHATPTVDNPIAERDIGGLGIHFVVNLIDESSYERKASRNYLTLKKLIHP